MFNIKIYDSDHAFVHNIEIEHEYIYKCRWGIEIEKIMKWKIIKWNVTLHMATTDKIERFIHILNRLIDHLTPVEKEANMLKEQGDDIGKL